ncbi:hypothetical protein [Ensifer canadensis]
MPSSRTASALSIISLVLGFTVVPALAQNYRDLPGVRPMDP